MNPPSTPAAAAALPLTDPVELAKAALVSALEALRWVMTQRAEKPSAAAMESVRRAATTVLNFARGFLPASPIATAPAAPAATAPPAAPRPASPATFPLPNPAARPSTASILADSAGRKPT